MKSIYIVDDDLSIVNILSDIITKNFPDLIVGKAFLGDEALEKILSEQPDIILLDYLLPDLHGLEIIRRIRLLYQPVIIMISEVSDTKMIEKAYNEEIYFYITKPLNVIEIISVIRRVIKDLDILNTLAQFKSVIQSIDYTLEINNNSNESNSKKLKKIFSKLGIVGLSGCAELIYAINWAKEKQNNYTLAEMYAELSGLYEGNKNNCYLIEKRIQRVITKAFKIMADLGNEDYLNPIFEEYSNLFFDFTELRKEMQYQKGKTNIHGKINVKKFIENCIILLDD